jgi:hypothetical protein
MNRFVDNPRSIVMALVAGSALFGASAAFAQWAPERTAGTYAPAQMTPVDLHVSTGWHGDRYWDGRRYWDHDEWMHRHPRDHDPHRDHDERRPPPDHRY